MASILRNYAVFTSHQRPTTGDVKMSFVGIDHLGWLICNGRSLSKSEYGILFNVIGYTFGGSGDSFNLPDVSGVVPGIVGPTHPVGTQVGSETHTLTIAEMPAHNHGGTTGSSTTGITANDTPPSSGLAQRTGANTLTTTDSSPGELDLVNAGDLILTDPGHTHTIASQGGGQAHNNMQPTYFIGNMFIYSGDPPAGTWPYTIPVGGGKPLIY